MKGTLTTTRKPKDGWMDGFKLKEWTYSNDNLNRDDTEIPVEPVTATEKVLGVVWDPRQDHFKFTVKSSFCPTRKKMRIQKNKTPTDIPPINGNPDAMTKRIILSQFSLRLTAYMTHLD